MDGQSRAAAAATFALVGAATTWLVLAFGVPALVISAALILVALVRGDRRLRAGSMLLGAGTTALLLGGAQYARCAGALDCAPPDMSTFFAVSVALIGFGATLLIAPRAGGSAQ